MAPFVGRRAELGVLRACLADARAGRPRVALVQGASGIGKTALLDALLAEAARDPGVVVLRASGDSDERLIAYGLLGQLVRSAGPVAAERVSMSTGDTVEPAGDEPLVDPITAGSHWLAVLDSMAGSVVVLAVDDAHWADRQSLQALVFALRRLVADRVLAVFGSRTDGVDDLPESLTRLVAGHLGAMVRLDGFDEQELRDLAGALGVDDLSVSAARRLRLGTQGNPLHARALLEEFPVSQWPVNRQDDSLLPPPRSFRHVVGRRYDDCGPVTRALLDAVAVLGLAAPVADAAALAGVAEPVAAIDEATEHGLLRVGRLAGPAVARLRLRPWRHIAALSHAHRREWRGRAAHRGRRACLRSGHLARPAGNRLPRLPPGHTAGLRHAGRGRPANPGHDRTRSFPERRVVTRRPGAGDPEGVPYSRSGRCAGDPRRPGALGRFAFAAEIRPPGRLVAGRSLGPDRDWSGRARYRAGSRAIESSRKGVPRGVPSSRPGHRHRAGRVRRLGLVVRWAHDLLHGPGSPRRERGHLAPAGCGRNAPARGAVR